ncbi:hypothetical protein TTHERM_01266110 (macronuclear) [Tetrahymena thermophila SB210]|uniref:Uncharacterized protein n=1 Tax=Tetrahymena thermophila (strain SB210) TaxID=312017 RepID=Q248K0_TETTS|nr:hypothetical protein TTHERM_01266110 [Tetrahymena thermophila SB210]EAS04205.1 hypothetical protein TTHERM_01266110 [Tetrahymena thermophila SB210]|eukprot:XP_001024450.1 hypothetical protein TTHERM_01266110 [Tetrahymena thermophila SB210]
MSIDYKEEINKLIRLQKQQSYLRQNKHNLNINLQLQNQQQTNTEIPQQLSNNVQFLLQGNKSQLGIKEEQQQFIPKGTRPKILSQKKSFQIPNTNSQIYYSTDPGDTDFQNNSLVGIQQNSLFSISSKKVVQDKSYLVKDIIEFQNSQNPEYNEVDIKNQDFNFKESIDQQNQYQQDEYQNEQIKQTDYYKINQENGQQYKQQNYINKQNYANRSLNQSPQKEIMIQDQAEQQERGKTFDNLKEYGVDEIQIKSGGGGMIKKKKKYDYKFRDVNELVYESESKAPYWMVDMRYTPRLYEKKMKLQTINEWKNQRMISCEEDQMAKQDMINAKEQNKKRLEEQIDSISKQQFQWEYVVSQQLQKYKVRNQNNSIEQGLSDYKISLFQNDFDKRIHNLYIDEKLLKFSAEKQSAEQQMIQHQLQLEKERDRLRSQEIRQSREKMRKRQSNNQSNFHSIESPERMNQSQYDGFNNKGNQNNLLINQFGDTIFNMEQQKNIKIDEQNYIKSSNENAQQNGSTNFVENQFLRHLINSSQQSLRLNDSTDLNPNDQVKKLYNYFENNQSKREHQSQNTVISQINYTTSDCKAKESIETYIQKQMDLQTKTKFPTIQRSTSRDNKQKTLFSLSEKKQKQHNTYSPNKSFSKKLSVDHQIQRYYINNNQRYPSPQLNYNVQIDYSNNKRPFFQQQNRSKSSNRKGFLNQTFVKF